MSLNPIIALDYVIEECRALRTKLDRPLFFAQESFYQVRPYSAANSAGVPQDSLARDQSAYILCRFRKPCRPVFEIVLLPP
jgi:hypothetical protein